MKKYFIIAFSIVIAGLTTSCSLDPTVADEMGTDVTDIQTMRQLMDGSYAQMVDYRYWGRNMLILGEVRADNVYANGSSGRFAVTSRMNLLPTSGDVDDTFRYAYATTANPNIIINSDWENVAGDEADKKHILGEAYAVRAMVHFDLLRLFGQAYSEGDLGVSYITEFKADDVNVSRGTIEENKAKIYADINKAIAFFEEGASSQYASSKINFTLDAAYALKSRVATYFKDYDIALEASSELINKYTVTPASEVVSYWSMSTPGEASIFELQQTTDNSQGINGLAYIYRGTSYGDIQCFDNLVSDVGFEAGDVRASSDMIDTINGKVRNMGKYPHMETLLGSDNIKVFRFAEVVLNHAEALLETGNAGDALTYLNMIPENRNASAYTQATLENIEKERRKELLFEGFRFFDLARFGQDIRDIEPTSTNNHGLIPAGDYRFAMPIPQKEMDANTAAVQNPGY